MPFVEESVNLVMHPAWPSKAIPDGVNSSFLVKVFAHIMAHKLFEETPGTIAYPCCYGCYMYRKY